jgi:hypothetical protein
MSKVKVVTELSDGTREETEAENLFHAQNIALYSFVFARADERGNLTTVQPKKVTVPVAGIEFWLDEKNVVQHKGITKEFQEYLNDVEKKHDEKYRHPEWEGKDSITDQDVESLMALWSDDKKALARGIGEAMLECEYWKQKYLWLQEKILNQEVALEGVEWTSALSTLDERELLFPEKSTDTKVSKEDDDE